MGLRVWAGFIGASIFLPIYYVAILPAWFAIRDTCVAFGVDPLLLSLLDRVLYWAPLLIVFAALIHAFVSPSFRRQPTWRDR